MTTGTIEWPFSEAGDALSIIALVEFHLEPAGGDGWNEPREDACCIIDDVKLIRRVLDFKRTPNGTYVREHRDTPIDGDAPRWVYDVLIDSVFLRDAMMDDLGDIPTRAAVMAEARYDEMRGK